MRNYAKETSREPNRRFVVFVTKVDLKLEGSKAKELSSARKFRTKNLEAFFNRPTHPKTPPVHSLLPLEVTCIVSIGP